MRTRLEEKIRKLGQALRRPLPGPAAHGAVLPPGMDESVERVWGATARILAEFLAIWSRL